MIHRITIAVVVWALGTPAIGSPAPGVDIYLLADASIELPAALKVPLAQLDLQEKPWIPFDAVKYYPEFDTWRAGLRRFGDWTQSSTEVIDYICGSVFVGFQPSRGTKTGREL